MLSHFTVADNNSSLNNDNPSGLVVATSGSTTNEIRLNHFFGLGDIGGTVSFPIQGSPSMNGVFGAANGPELEMFVYSSKLEARIVTPVANLTGTMFRGTMRLGQLFRSRNATTSFVDLKVTVGDLIRASDHIQAMQSKFSLHSAMVNDCIISSQIRNDGYKFTDYIKDTNLAMEIVDYVVLQTPTLTITDGTDRKSVV